MLEYIWLIPLLPLATAALNGLLALSFGYQVARGPVNPETVSIKNLARELFSQYLLPFEIVGLLLLVAVIGATVAARRPPQTETREPEA